MKSGVIDNWSFWKHELHENWRQWWLASDFWWSRMEDLGNLLNRMNLAISMYDRRAVKLALTRDWAEGLSSISMGCFKMFNDGLNQWNSTFKMSNSRGSHDWLVTFKRFSSGYKVFSALLSSSFFHPSHFEFVSHVPRVTPPKQLLTCVPDDESLACTLWAILFSDSVTLPSPGSSGLAKDYR